MDDLVAAIDDLLENNRAYAASFALAGLAAPPAKGLTVLTCMDVRLELGDMLGLRPGDAHILRNAGGRMQDALRSLAISQLFLKTEEVAIIHHTECGLADRSDPELRVLLTEARGTDPGDIAFYPFTDLAESVREDIAIYDASPLVRHDIPVRGFIYDVATGLLTEVER